MQDQVISYLKNKQHKLCVIATSSNDGKPEAAVVGYAVKEDLTILLSTHQESRKYKNIKENHHVALVFGWSFTELSVQMEGIARPVEQDYSEYKEAEEFFFTQNPDAAKFKSSDTVFIEIKPEWIRSMDLTVHPTKTEETRL